MAKQSNLISLGDAISQIFKEEKLDEKYSIFAIRNDWPKIVGEMIAKHTTQINFANGHLYVSLDSAIVRNEMTYAKLDIITKVNAFVGSRLIKELVLK
jgi:predicted nucleic acid-binding Zn ribbon protein